MKTPLAAAVATFAILAAGCGTNAVAQRGFIPSQVRMQKAGDLVHEWRAKGMQASEYGKVVVKPVETPAGDSYGDLTAEQLATVRGTFERALGSTFAKGVGTGGKTLVVHAAITEIKPNQPLRNIAPQTQILKRGYGYAACELYATDGEGGPVVAAYMQTIDTTRFGAEKLSPTGTAERACGEWAEGFRSVITR